MPWIYNADIFCDSCGEEIKKSCKEQLMKGDGGKTGLTEAEFDAAIATNAITTLTNIRSLPAATMSRTVRSTAALTPTALKLKSCRLAGRSGHCSALI